MQTFLGTPCKYGHTDENGQNLRAVYNRVCIKCKLDHARKRAKKPEVRERNRIATKVYQAKYPGRVVQSQIKYRKRRIATDPYFALVDRLRSRLRRALGAGYQKSADGIDYQSIAIHLGPKPGPDYQVDHIMPLNQFDLSDWSQVLRAFAPENHRWLPSGVNLRRPRTGSDLQNFQHVLPIGLTK